ncbi:MAG: hypothetical protein HW391_1345 [Chloroflexi bacterium]|nr:hypothetical protein [Chloroflexota bacterium]
MAAADPGRWVVVDAARDEADVFPDVLAAARMVLDPPEAGQPGVSGSADIRPGEPDAPGVRIQP